MLRPLPLSRALANRDVDGSTVIDGNSNYQATAMDCYLACKNTTGCNLWIYCANTLGCSSSGSGDQYTLDLSKYRQCWGKYDNPTRQGFPFVKNTATQEVGWLSGTMAGSTAASAGLTDTTYAGCSCKASYSAGGSNFKV
ncbi:MAG: hypothetical protein WDW38_009000 [Sanguina aurantia]